MSGSRRRLVPCPRVRRVHDARGEAHGRRMALDKQSTVPHLASGQGRHPDPAEADGQPDHSGWPELWRRAYLGDETRLIREALHAPGNSDVRAGVLDDLTTYFKLPADECIKRARDWEAWSVEEWFSQPRDSEESITEFYQTTNSWSFDLLWNAYLQAEGYAAPISAAIAQFALKRTSGRSHLDFGSGIGITSQLFRRLGFETSLADISTTLLAFAKFRLERRGEDAHYIDLNQATLEPNSYDVITAIDTLAHVVDLRATASMLHASLRPGGLLFANFDTRAPAPENAWHLYDDDLPLRWTLHRVGFEPVQNLDGLSVAYVRVDPGAAMHTVRGVRDFVSLRSPARRMVRRARWALRRGR